MFNENQERKIKVFASITKVTNICFTNCSISIEENHKLSNKEINCLKECSNNYMELNHNITNQLKMDKEKTEEKNISILQNKT